MLRPTPDGGAEVVAWRPATRSWVRGGADVSDVMKGRPLSPAELERAGISLPPSE